MGINGSKSRVKKQAFLTRLDFDDGRLGRAVNREDPNY